MWTFFLITENTWLSPGILVKVIQDISILLFYLLSFQHAFYFYQVVKTTDNSLEVTRYPYNHIFLMMEFCVGSSLEAAKINSSLVRSDLWRYGFEINLEKSNWEPKNKFSWSGYKIDTHTGFIFASDARIEKLCSDPNAVCANLEQSAFVHVKTIASIVGQIMSMTSSCGNVSQIMTRYLLLIIYSRHSWNSFVSVQDQGKQELHFWRDNLKTLNGVLFCMATAFCSVQIFFFSDASLSGCGAFVQGSSLVSPRNWSTEESQVWREPAAIKFALAAFEAQLSGLRVDCYTDNQNVVRIILEELWGPHSVDRFACCYKAKLPRFNSRFLQPGVEAVAAFSQAWSSDNNWLVPLITLIGRVLCHMRDCKAVRTLIVLMWKSAQFWPLLCSDGVHLNSFVKDFVTFLKLLKILHFIEIAFSFAEVHWAIYRIR